MTPGHLFRCNPTLRFFRVVAVLALLSTLFNGTKFVRSQTAAQPRSQTGHATLGLEQGFLEFDTPDFKLKLVKSSQTLAALEPKGTAGFDFSPADRLESRARDGYHHLGDINLRIKTEENEKWRDYSTASSRKPVKDMPAASPTLAEADLSPTMAADCPLTVTRRWLIQDGRLALRFDLKNNSTRPVEVGSLSMPMVFNNIITGRSLQQAHEICSFSDPYIGNDAGYLQVTRLNGKGPALLVVPEDQTPFEAWQPLNEPTRPIQTFEGTFGWMVHSRAYVENEWRNAQPWNTATSTRIQPGKTRTYGVRFLRSDGIREIEKTLADSRHPVAVGIPGYVLPADIEGQLFLNSPRRISRLFVEPEGAISFKQKKPLRTGWQSFTLRSNGWGRARVTVLYEGGSTQTISYYLIKSSSQAVADLGRFLMTRQWYQDSADPFGRSPSVMSYDRETDKIVAQDSRVWIAGLGDEGGSGSWLAAAMKQFGQPDKEELAKYEQFIDKVLWGGLQYKDGPNTYGVRKSLFFYSPQDVPSFKYEPSLNWTTWTSWKKTDSESIGRGYNYPHVVAAYWALYRTARNYEGLAIGHSWDWYLDQAYQTTRFAFSKNTNGRRRVGYVDLGLMGGTVFLTLLEDLKREGWHDKAMDLESLMKERAVKWSGDAYPFGSEMAWDSTGQEEVYAWCRYFGHDDKALVSLNSILGYMPTLPHWGYNGNARRYWDFLYAGKLTRIERQLHHYGSGLNAIPVLTHYRSNPNDYYLLRVGYGGLMGALSNIDREGFASVAFHSFPSTLKWDGYSGDYGPNFLGHALNTATYVIDHPDFGWQAFGGNVKADRERVRIRPADSFRMRAYIAPLGLWLTLDSGRLEEIELSLKNKSVRVGLNATASNNSTARLRLEQPAKVAGVGMYVPREQFNREREAYTIPLRRNVRWVELVSR